MTDPRLIARCVLSLAGIVIGPAILAQETTPSTAAAAAEKAAQKTADRTMYWIRMLGQTPASVPRPAAAPKSAPTASASSAAAATKLVADRTKVAPAAEHAAASAPTPAPAQTAVVVPAEAILAAEPTAAGPSLPDTATAGSAVPVNTMPASGLDPGGAAAAGLVAPAVTAPRIDLPPVAQEPDPGLVMIKSVDPDFPYFTMRRLRKGEVEVEFEVAPDGKVAAVNVIKTSNPSLNAAAMDAVRQWIFKPTPKGHTATVKMGFNLDT